MSYLKQYEYKVLLTYTICKTKIYNDSNVKNEKGIQKYVIIRSLYYS